MSLSQFVDLVRLALPEDVQMSELRRFAPQELWRGEPYIELFAHGLLILISEKFYIPSENSFYSRYRDKNIWG